MQPTITRVITGMRMRLSMVAARNFREMRRANEAVGSSEELQRHAERQALAMRT
jgi:hypothetical protein